MANMELIAYLVVSKHLSVGASRRGEASSYRSALQVERRL